MWITSDFTSLWNMSGRVTSALEPGHCALWSVGSRLKSECDRGGKALPGWPRAEVCNYTQTVFSIDFPAQISVGKRIYWLLVIYLKLYIASAVCRAGSFSLLPARLVHKRSPLNPRPLPGLRDCAVGCALVSDAVQLGQAPKSHRNPDPVFRLITIGSFLLPLFLPPILPSLLYNKVQCSGKHLLHHSNCMFLSCNWFQIHFRFILCSLYICLMSCLHLWQACPPLWATRPFRRPSTTASYSRHSVTLPSTPPFACPTAPHGDGLLPSALSLCLLVVISAGVWPSSFLPPCRLCCPPSHRYTHVVHDWVK